MPPLKPTSGLGSTLAVPFLTVVISLTSLPLWGQADALPDPAPPFQADGEKRVEAVLKDASYLTPEGIAPLYSLEFGNKSIGIKRPAYSKRKDNIVSITLDNHEVLDFAFWGSYGSEAFGYPFLTKEGTVPKVVADPESRTITYSKEYLTPDGATETFSFVLKPAGEGNAELSWTCSGPQGVQPRMTFIRGQREAGIDVDGTPVDFLAPSALSEKPYEPTPVWHGSVSEIVRGSNKPDETFKVSFPEQTECSASEFYGGGKQIYFECKLATCREGKLTIDFGKTSSRAAGAPPPLFGIDFWKNDAVHVPPSNSRNLIPNPSFEQGLRFWRWWKGGGTYQPVETPVYSTVKGGLFGDKALAVRTYPGALVAESLPLTVENGKTYTVSFYAKAETPGCSVMLGVASVPKGSQYTPISAQSTKHVLKTTDWERKSFTFTSDTRGICLELSASQPVLIDGLQLEEGTKPTDFVAPPVEATLVTSDPHNVVEAGQPIDAKFLLSGKPGSTGNISVSVRDFYRQNVLSLEKRYTLDGAGLATLDLPLDGALGKGNFVVKAEFLPDGGTPFTDYYRVSILKSLDNTHPTATLFGNSFEARITEADALGKLYMRYGWGHANGYGISKETADFLDKYRITHGSNLIFYNSGYQGFGRLKGKDLINKFREVCLKKEHLTDEDLKFVEDTVYSVVMDNLWCKAWALTTEAETTSVLIKARNFDEYAKLQFAFRNGVLRAMPDATVYSDGGTSGFNDARGIVETAGYLAATQGKVKWDAVAIHPYGSIDGVNSYSDLDAGLGKLVELMKKYGYGPETPIDIPEYFNMTSINIPEWGDTGWNDNFSAGPPSYDSGWKEFLTAARAARTYIMSLKYWPHLRTSNIWCPNNVLIDQHLTPIALCMVPNTLGTLFPNPKFRADIRPAAGIRGYAFDDENGNCTVAIWCAIDKVEEGLEKGPTIGVKFDGLAPQVFDLMGNERRLPDAVNGVTSLQLSPAPLFLRVDKQGAEGLVAALSKAEVTGVGSALRVVLLPTPGGQIEAKLENLTGNQLKGKLSMKNSSVPFDLPPMGSSITKLPFALRLLPGTIEPWEQTLSVEFANGKRETLPWKMSCFTVPHTPRPLPLDPGDKAWDSIPAIPVDNWMVKDTLHPPKHGGPGDLDAKFQIAWDKDNLYLRVTAKDDRVVPLPQDQWNERELYKNDGCVEVYIDTVASALSNLTKGYDQYDYRYDFAPSDGNAASGPGSVCRLQEVHSQLAGGTSMPTKEQVAKGGIKCEYRRTADGFSYVMILPQLYIEPLHLEKGWRAGFALFIHDKDEGEQKKPNSPEKGVSTSTEKGVSPNFRPDLWPVMVLGD